jgi:hypothetical protein
MEEGRGVGAGSAAPRCHGCREWRSWEDGSEVPGLMMIESYYGEAVGIACYFESFFYMNLKL